MDVKNGIAGRRLLFMGILKGFMGKIGESGGKRRHFFAEFSTIFRLLFPELVVPLPLYNGYEF